MKALILSIVLVFMSSTLTQALDIPTGYNAEISGLSFYPSGAKFQFTAEPEDGYGNFTVHLPGMFTPDSIRLLTPEQVNGDIKVEEHSRPTWTPPQLESLKAERDSQAAKVDSLTARQSALEQTLTLLKSSTPDKADKPDDLLTYIKDAQTLRQKTEEELAALKTELAQERETLAVMNNELEAKRPADLVKYFTITGRAKYKNAVIKLEAFTHAASWSPRYTMDLNSTTGDIDVHMFVRTSQRTGLDYEGAVTFHTKNPDERITTPELSPQRVSIKQHIEPPRSAMGSMRMRSYMAAPMEEGLAADLEVNEATAPIRPKTPAIRETLSDRTLYIEGMIPGDNSEREFEAGALTLKSKPVVLVIPQQRADAWILASMDEGNESLIPGTADLRVDGQASGKIFVQEFGQGQRRIPFGYAEQITVKKESLIGKTGSSWFTGGVFSSGYKLEITNGTKSDRVITIRDRLPIPTDERIKLDVKHIDPKEKDKDRENRYTWELNIPAGRTETIIVDYSLSYPSGEELEYR